MTQGKIERWHHPQEPNPVGKLLQTIADRRLQHQLHAA